MFTLTRTFSFLPQCKRTYSSQGVSGDKGYGDTNGICFLHHGDKDRDDATNGKTFSVSLGAMAVVIVIKYVHVVYR